jgi:large subunit ribosomal protein L25
MAEMILSVQTRTEVGKNANRRLRRAGRVPGVVYGSDAPALVVSIDPKRVKEILHSETGVNTLCSLELDGERDSKARLLIQEVQYDPVSDEMLHVDLTRISMEKEVRIQVPVQLVGTAKGVKLEGGILDFITRELEVTCMPANIPDHIRIDVSELGIGDSRRVEDLPVSESYRIDTEPERPILVIATPTEEKEEEAVAAEPEVTEPELVSRKGKEAAEEEGEEPSADQSGKQEQEKE